MTRAELERWLHAVRVEAYALALFDERPQGWLTAEQTQKARLRCHEIAERRVSEYERKGRFTTDAERVA